MSFAPFAVEPKPLPVPIPSFANETAASLASRAAVEYARGNATTFLNDLGLRFDEVGFGERNAVLKLAVWLGADPKALLDATPILKARGRPELRGQSFCAYPSIPLSPRICPVCLAEDRAAGQTHEHLRTLWSMPAVGACPIHGVLLEYLPRPPHNRGARDLHFCLGLWSDRRLPDPRPVASYALELAVQDFLDGGPDQVGPWPLVEVLATVPLLGCFVEAGPVWPTRVESSALQRYTETGFSLLQEGQVAVDDAVAGRVAKRLAEGARSPSEVLGCLKGTIRHFIKEPTLRPLFEALHTAATRRMRMHTEYSFLNQTIPPFTQTTIGTLSQSHEVSRATVRFALRADKVQPVAEITAFGKSYPVYRRIEADNALKKVKEKISHSNATTLLGMNRPTFEQVWKAKLIPHELAWPRQGSFLWHHEVEALRDALHAAAPLATEPPGSDWISLSDFSRRSRQGQAETARLLLAGDLSPACRLPDLQGWSSIRIQDTHIRKHRKPPAIPAGAKNHLAVETLSQRYALRFVTITRLVELGALPSSKRQKVDGRRMDGYSIKAVEHFFGHHRTLRDLAQAQDCSCQMMMALLERLDVHPLIAEKGHTKLYAVADLPAPKLLAEEIETSKARNARFKTSK